MDSYFSAIISALYILIIKIFTLPISIVKSSINSLNKGSSKNTDFVIMTYMKNTYEALIVLCYPIGLIVVFLSYGYLLDLDFLDVEEFFAASAGTLIGIYFIPILLGFFRESLSLFVMTAINIEKIAQNTSSAQSAPKPKRETKKVKPKPNEPKKDEVL